MKKQYGISPPSLQKVAERALVSVFVSPCLIGSLTKWFKNERNLYKLFKAPHQNKPQLWSKQKVLSLCIAIY